MYPEINWSDYRSATGLKKLYKYRDIFKSQGHEAVKDIQNAIDQIEKSVQKGAIAEQLKKYKQGYQAIEDTYQDTFEQLKKAYMKASGPEEKKLDGKINNLLSKVNEELEKLQEKIWPAYKKINELWENGTMAKVLTNYYEKKGKK